MAEKERPSLEKLDKISHTRNKTWFSILVKLTLIVYVDILRYIIYPIPCLKYSR